MIVVEVFSGKRQSDMATFFWGMIGMIFICSTLFPVTRALFKIQTAVTFMPYEHKFNYVEAVSGFEKKYNSVKSLPLTFEV